MERGKMTDSGPQLISVRTFRNDIKEILDGTRFLKHHYIVTNYGQAVAQVVPPDDAHDMDRLTVTDVRTKTREILEAVGQHNQAFLIVRYGRPEALICPLRGEHTA
jgi:antitoxin (DNA-binding transcriptional repressor) of toxin-antitoxin stability system